MWCSDSIWGGGYACRHTVIVERYSEGMSPYDDVSTKDWSDIVEEIEDFFDEKAYLKIREKNLNKNVSRDRFIKDTYRLKPEVVEWLNANVKPRIDEDKQDSSGWGVGSDFYNVHSVISFSIFFHRRRDALAFIKHWSEHKKPTFYFNYFHDIKKKLNLTTNKLELVVE